MTQEFNGIQKNNKNEKKKMYIDMIRLPKKNKDDILLKCLLWHFWDSKNWLMK